MATITRELLGNGPFFKKDAAGNDIPSGREVYRIRVRAERGKEFSDFHLRIDMGRRLPGANFVFGNNHNEIKILRPSSRDISQPALRDRGPRTRTWRGTYQGWNVPSVSIIRGTGNREVYLNFYADDCIQHSEFVFDIVIEDLLQIKEYWTTRCRRDNGIFDPNRATVVENEETTEIEEREVQKGGVKKKVKTRVTKIKKYKISKKKKKVIKKAKKIIKKVLYNFDKEASFAAMESAMEDFGYFISIHEMPLSCNQNGDCIFDKEDIEIEVQEKPEPSE